MRSTPKWEMMTRTARGMALDTPGLDDKFRLPRSNAERAWLTAARTFHADALPLKDDFIAHEMPADFLDTLDALITDYEAGACIRPSEHGKTCRRERGD